MIISEFMADNKSILTDNYGESSDWIEVCNVSATNVNLFHWGLTDSAGDSTPWRFPATNLAAGTTMIVFASGRNISVAGAALHTDFALKAAGEYLGLIRPDGTIATEFAPQFPAQLENVSYGYGRQAEVVSLFNTNWQGRVRVPLDGTLGLDWTARQFADAAWAKATNAIGFESSGGASVIVPDDVLADAPLAYWRFTEAGTNSGAFNSGSLGTAAKGTYTAAACPPRTRTKRGSSSFSRRTWRHHLYSSCISPSQRHTSRLFPS